MALSLRASVAAWLAVAGLAAPASAQVIVNRYTFETNFNDVGGGPLGPSNATAFGATLAGGNAVLVEANSNYINLNLPTAYANAVGNLAVSRGLPRAITVEAWFTNTNTNGWSRVFDFGNTNGNGLNYIFATPRSGPGDTRIGINNGTEQNAIRPTPTSDGAQHQLVAVFNETAQTQELYVDGVLANTGPMTGTNTLANLNFVNSYLGRANFGADPFFNGTYADFRIWAGSLSAPQVALNFAAGPNVLGVPEPGTLALTAFGAVAVVWRCRRGKRSVATA